MSSTMTAAPARLATRIASVDILRGVGDGAHGHRPRPRLLRRSGRRSDGRRLLHALGHALLRAGCSCSSPARRRTCTARRLRRRATLSRYLVTRGLLLVAARARRSSSFSWTFGLDYSRSSLAGVIWMLGWCMVLLAALVRLPPRAVGIARPRRDRPRPGRCFVAASERAADRAVPASWLWEFIYPSATARRDDQRALHDRPVDRRDGRGIRVRRDHAARNPASRRRLVPAHRPLR